MRPNRIAVTGANGKLGRVVTRRLLDAGYDVVALDVAGTPEPDATYVRIDLADYGQVADALAATDDRYPSVDAVVHLAAFPAPGLVPNVRTFQNNAIVDFNVFSAARLHGITNIVFASSETVLGVPFALDPPYLPVDEEVARPESTYSLTKLVAETTAAQFARWDPRLKILGLRFSNVMLESDYAGFPAFDADPSSRAWNLWCYIDARDAAQAVQKALEWDGTGFDTFIIASPDTVMSRSTASLIAGRFPDVELRREFGEREAPMSIEKARRILGYAPEFGWRDAL